MSDLTPITLPELNAVYADKMREGKVVILYHANCVDGFYAHMVLRKNLFKQLPYDIFSEDRLPEKYRKVEDDIVDIFNHIVESANMLRERCPSSNIENLLLDVVFKDR